MKTSDIYQSTAEYKAAICELGRLADLGTSSKDLLKAQQMIEKNESCSSLFLPMAHIRKAFELTLPESIALTISAARLYSGHSFLNWNEFSALLNRFDGAEYGNISLLFRNNSINECFHPLAADFLMERRPNLPGGMLLDFCAQQCLYHSSSLFEEMNEFVDRVLIQKDALPAAIVLGGQKDSGRKFLFSQLAAKQGTTLLILNGKDPIDCESATVAALLYNSIICIDGYSKSNIRFYRELMERFGLLLFAAEQGEFFVTDFFSDGMKCTLLKREPEIMNAAERLAAMTGLFGCDNDMDTADLRNAAELYRPNIGTIIAAAHRFRAEQLTGILKKDYLKRMISVLREANTAYLTGNAQLISTNKKMEDLVLPVQQKQQLSDLCAFAKTRNVLYYDWGFADKIPYGRGLSALFYGASGTGKTMAASVLANELGLELYRIDLSRLISKYIGETQKNIGKIFDDAQNCDCILFFDEADALFSRRGEAGNSQDKYANAEIAYLLQRTEEYDGIILMATNLLQNFDEAFRRRIGFMIHFPLPDQNLRELMWRGIFPAKAPIKNLDYPLLAEQLEISGAEIRNCALNAAYLAASQNMNITMSHVIAAARIEYKKQGKTFPQKLDMLFFPERG